MSRIITGTLPIGVEVAGVLHRDFTLRASTVADNIAVTEEFEATGERPGQLRLATALMARQLVSLGTLTTYDMLKTKGDTNGTPEVTTELVRCMATADWNHLDKLSEDQEKKLLSGGQTPPQAGGSMSEPGPSSTASTSTS